MVLNCVKCREPLVALAVPQLTSKESFALQQIVRLVGGPAASIASVFSASPDGIAEIFNMTHPNCDGPNGR